MSDIETINIGELDNSISLEEPSNSQPSVNFGPGLELLMNDKKGSMKSSSSGDDGIHVDDLANLESE